MESFAEALRRERTERLAHVVKDVAIAPQSAPDMTLEQDVRLVTPDWERYGPMGPLAGLWRA